MAVNRSNVPIFGVRPRQQDLQCDEAILIPVRMSLSQTPDGMGGCDGQARTNGLESWRCWLLVSRYGLEPPWPTPPSGPQVALRWTTSPWRSIGITQTGRTTHSSCIHSRASGLQSDFLLPPHWLRPQGHEAEVEDEHERHQHGAEAVMKEGSRAMKD
jgi:hypothetical protein